MQSPVLIIHNRPDDFRGDLEMSFPGLDFVYATSPEEVIPALEANDPEVVFSIKQSIFPAESHLPILDWPSVEWVQVGGSGYEHFDPWEARRLTLTNAAGVLAPYLAETIIGALLALNGGFLQYVESQRRRVWRPSPFKPLCDQTLMVIGLGSIGSLVAKNAQALGMHVIGIRTSGQAHPHADEVFPVPELKEVVGRADALTLHVRVTPQTVDLVDGPLLAAMKPGAFLLNASRGAVVEEKALAEALTSGHLGGAWLDVFKTEPLPAKSPVWDLPNLLISPHSSDNVNNWPSKFAEFFKKNLKRRLAGQELLNVVQPDQAMPKPAD